MIPLIDPFTIWEIEMMKKLLLVPSALLSGLMFSQLSNAAAGAAVDVTDVTGTISAQLGSIGTVGVAVLAVVVAIAAYKWVRRAI